jgi:hypothetical protein
MERMEVTQRSVAWMAMTQDAVSDPQNYQWERKLIADNANP